MSLARMVLIGHFWGAPAEPGNREPRCRLEDGVSGQPPFSSAQPNLPSGSISYGSALHREDAVSRRAISAKKLRRPLVSPRARQVGASRISRRSELCNDGAQFDQGLRTTSLSLQIRVGPVCRRTPCACAAVVLLPRGSSGSTLRQCGQSRAERRSQTGYVDTTNSSGCDCRATTVTSCR